MHILVSVTPHGLGHAAQVIPVINSLKRSRPGWRFTVSTTVPQAFLASRIEGEFDYHAHAADFGLIMKSALEIDLPASAAAYDALHADWPGRVEQEAALLASMQPDLVLADVPCLTLAAAQRASIPALALCSLNWADVYRHYFTAYTGSAGVLADMESACRSAIAFLCPEPSMPMPFLDNRVELGPIAATGSDRSAQLRANLGIDDGMLLVMVAPGGVETRFELDRWPVRQGIHWLVPARWQVQHPDVSAIEDCDCGFTDLVASCDAVLGKCGYGTVTECVANGTPLLYVARPDWPEESVLVQWLRRHNAAIEVPAQRLRDGNFSDLVDAISAARVIRCQLSGAEQAAGWVQRCLESDAAGIVDRQAADSG